MKKQLSVIKIMLIIVAILSIIQIVFLIIEPDLKHIILSVIVIIGLCLIIALYIICKLEIQKIKFEFVQDDYKVRLIDEDDYQYVRILLDNSQLENSLEESKKLEEYKKITIDFTRIHYHYIVFKNDELICVFQDTLKNSESFIEFKNEFPEKNDFVEILKKFSNENNHKINFIN